MLHWGQIFCAGWTLATIDFHTLALAPIASEDIASMAVEASWWGLSEDFQEPTARRSTAVPSSGLIITASSSGFPDYYNEIFFCERHRGTSPGIYHSGLLTGIGRYYCAIKQSILALLFHFQRDIYSSRNVWEARANENSCSALVGPTGSVAGFSITCGCVLGDGFSQTLQQAYSSACCKTMLFFSATSA